MVGYRPWKKWSGILAAATGLDFQRKVIPFLRLFWPTLQETPARRHWDAKGIDLFVWSDDEHFPCVVQCKGFEVQQLGYDQRRQAVQSIRCFLHSEHTTETYVLVHNRDRRNKEFNDAVESELSELVSNGKADRVVLWDRQTLLDKAFQAVRGLVDQALRKHCEELLRDSMGLFEFAGHYVSEVPIKLGLLKFKRGEPCELVRGEIERHELASLLASDVDTRWTLLIGLAGTGKTTSVLAMALNSTRSVIYIPCASLPGGHPITSTNTLLEEAAKCLCIADMFEDTDREVLTEICGPVLGNLLRQPQSPYILILDGLDENSYFSRLEGLQKLSNQLADLQCSIIMTTRSEHLYAMFGDFSLAFDEFSVKFKPRRHGRLVELTCWEKNQMLALLEHAITEAEGLARTRLIRFRRMVAKDQYQDMYGELPSNPLYMQFVLEDIAYEGITPSSPAGLLFRWIRRKILRDRAVTTRPTLGELLDTEEFADRMLYLMENLAGGMVSESEGLRVLHETMSAERVKSEARVLFEGCDVDILPLLLNTVLTPTEPRKGTSLKLRFSFRIFQEFMLASYLVREVASVESFPSSVKELVRHIEAELEARPGSALASHLLSQANT